MQHDSPTNKNVPMNKDTKVTSPSKTKEMTGIKKSPICVKDGKKWKIVSLFMILIKVNRFWVFRYL